MENRKIKSFCHDNDIVLLVENGESSRVLRQPTSKTTSKFPAKYTLCIINKII